MNQRQNHRNVLRSAAVAGLIAALLVGGLATGEATAKDQVRIALVDAGGAVVESSTSGTLELNRKYVKGDRILVSGAGDLAYEDCLDLVVKVDEHYPEATLFVPKKTVPDRPLVDFPIPLWQTGYHPEVYPHPPKAFQGEKHVITARAATKKEINAQRNLACNPIDPRGTSTYFPHASSNSEWGDATIYAARNAIDGYVEATGDHHSWPRSCWSSSAGPSRSTNWPSRYAKTTTSTTTGKR